ncbi:MAG: histidine--tRNA ligase [Parcubacteria group bacterium]|nr:histidine--tRNA ligase [Parcubacteria group bacterium]
MPKKQTKATQADILKKNIPQEKKKNIPQKRSFPVRRGKKADEEVREPNVNLLRGMKDILPADQKYWQFVEDRVKGLANSYRFDKIDTPIVEDTRLFTTAVGKMTDIVEKEMFSFINQSNETVTLRPEATASIARAYIGHGMHNLPQPVKLWYWGPMYRYERPQSGRQRQFHQFGFEIVGKDKPVVDAELVIAAHAITNSLGLDVEIQINSIGAPDCCRETYKEELISYYRARRSAICETCKARLTKNPLRLLDCKEPQCQPVKSEAPQIVDYLCNPCRDHFMKVLEYLDEIDVPYTLNPRLVRGLDYYTRTVFEIFVKNNSEERRAQSAIGGGGRYDLLIEKFGGRPTPAAGFAFGIERTIARIKEANIQVEDDAKVNIFLACLGEYAKRKSLGLFEDLRREGFRAATNFSKEKLKDQLELANKLKVKFTLILGQKEVLDETIIIRDMETGVQEVIDYKKISADLRRKLGMVE